MSQIRPYLIVPTLIEQPTWGGDYIASLKKIDPNQINNKKIGQSYELFRDSYLSLKTNTLNKPSIEIADPTDTQNPLRLSENDSPFPISDLIIEKPLKVLGQKVIENHGHSVEIMIKLNQASGNSFQVHTKEKTADDKWLPKPESWYYLEPGLVTLGLKPNLQIESYKNCCLEIERLTTQLSVSIQKKEISKKEAQIKLEQLINKLDPWQYVNTVQVGKHASIDLSGCGVHHSWEENAKTHPQGNVVYEVQKNVYDPDCTIRSFDKGKIKEDGTIRPIHVEDYFAALDTSIEANQPESHYKKPVVLAKHSTYTVKQIFTSKHYSLRSLSFNQRIENKWTKTNQSFHHIFVEKGSIELIWQDCKLIISQGFSCFIPASCDLYKLKPYKSKAVTVLQTYL